MFPSTLTTEFHVDAMKQMLLASAAAYSKSTEAESIARAAGATEFFWIADERTSTQGFIAANETDVVIAFCGTQEPRDWVTDCKFMRRRSAHFPGAVHIGFCDGYEAVRASVLSIFSLSSLKRGEGRGEEFNLQRRIWIAGHSLGGALAMLCAYDLVRGGIPIAGVYTFGQPRVGDTEFATRYDATPATTTARSVWSAWSLLPLSERPLTPAQSTTPVSQSAATPARSVMECGAHPPLSERPKLRDITFRIVNENDIVPRVPGVLIGYRHCGREVFLDSFGNIDVDPSILKKLCSDVWGIAAELHTKTRLRAVESLVRDHFLEAYKERILTGENGGNGDLDQTSPSRTSAAQGQTSQTGLTGQTNAGIAQVIKPNNGE